MFFYFKSLFKKSSWIALDQGLNEQRLLMLEKRGSAYHIEKMRVLSLDGDLLSLIKREGLEGACVTLAWPFSAILKTQIEFPFSGKEVEFVDELRKRLYQYFPGHPEDELYFDYQAGILVAARKGPIQNQVAALEKLGLYPRIVDVDAYALARAAAWHFFRNRKEEGVQAALFHLSSPWSYFLVMNRKDLIFSHPFSLEAASIEAVSQTLRKIWQLYPARHPERITNLGLSGEREMTFLNQLQALLEASFPLSVEVIRPFQGLTHSGDLSEATIESLSSRFLVCLGLALRGQDL